MEFHYEKKRVQVKKELLSSEIVKFVEMDVQSDALDEIDEILSKIDTELIQHNRIYQQNYWKSVA